LAFINPHGFLDNPTFRGMRWHLLKTYDKIYTIDLHGNSKKKETAPDGSADVNVFDIQQGVSINIFIKTGKKKPNDLGKVFHFDLFGSRDMKYDFLLENSIKDIQFEKLLPEKPFLLFVDRSNAGLNEYEKAFKLPELFTLNSVGMVSARDKFCIDDDLKELKKRIKEFANVLNSDAEIIKLYGLKDTSTFKLTKSRKNILNESDLDKFYKRVTYRPFDNKWIFYNDDVVERPIMKVMQHFHNGNNFGLVIGRQGQVVGSMPWNLAFMTNSMTDFNLFYRGGGMLFPLYHYLAHSGQETIGHTHTSTGSVQDRTPNLNPEIVKQIANKLGLTFTNEKETTKDTFAPIDILDYIYAILHSPTYREKYKEFLKIDFPRVPYPKDKETFWQLVKLGGEIRQIHLLESPAVEKYITQYPEDGNNVVVKPKYENGKVYINETQYFDNVPQVAWEFYIGGYQPAQKWLKDRKDRKLEFDDILHFQKIIVALTETDRLMKEIEKIEIE
jgi:predicted helicase